MSKKKTNTQVYTVPTSGTYQISVGNGVRIDAYNDNGIVIAEKLNDLMSLIDKNIECGLLLDWTLKVKDTRLARKMYPDHVIRKGWLYAKEN